MSKVIKTFKNLIVLYVVFLFLLPAFSQTATTELLGLKADKYITLIEVARRYPEVKFSNLQDPNRIQIELINTSYHKNFKFGEAEKNLFVSDLSFSDDVIVEEKYTVDSEYSVLITVLHNKNFILTPKILSTKNNIVKIIFLPELSSSLPTSDQVANEARDLYNLAVDEHIKGNLQEAEKLYNQIVSKDSKFYPAIFNLVQIYLNNKSYDKAIATLLTLLQEVQKISENNLDKAILVNLYNTTGTVFYLKGKINEANEQFYEVLRLDPKNYQAYFNIGLAYEKNKDIEEAKSNFGKAIELNPDFPDAHYHVAVLDLIQNDKKDATLRFKKVVELANGTKIAELSKQELKKLDKKFFKSLE